MVLRLGKGTRAAEVEVSVDGRRVGGEDGGLGMGVEVRIRAEQVGLGEGGGGVPCVVRGEGDEGWLAGLNGLLKFNHPFGEEDEEWEEGGSAGERREE